MSEYRGPTANQLQPPKRIQADLLYAEDLQEMFGGEAAKSGVHLEIVNVSGGVVSVDPAGKEKKKVIKLKLLRPGDKKPMEKQLGLNQTNKKALIAAFESEYVSEWVGWITLYVTLAKDQKNGGMVPAIRVKNVRPKLKPTFDYQRNTTLRKEAAAKEAKAPPQQPQPEPEVEPETKSTDLADQVAEQMARSAAARTEMTAEEQAAILAAERAEHDFTAEPDGES